MHNSVKVPNTTELDTQKWLRRFPGSPVVKTPASTAGHRGIRVGGGGWHKFNPWARKFHVLRGVAKKQIHKIKYKTENKQYVFLKKLLSC